VFHRAIVLARQEGHLKPDTDERQLAFQIHGLILALHYEARFLKNARSIDWALQSFELILERCATPGDKRRSPAARR
jgi:hypothetical protein